MARTVVHFLVAASATVLPARSYAQESDLGNAIADLPDVAMWHLKVFYLLPRNLADFERAIQAEKQQLKPGAASDYGIIMTVDPEGTPIRFVALAPQGDLLLPANQRRVATIRVTRERFVFDAPMPSLTKEQFGAMLRSLPTESPVKYEDHLFTVEAMNARNGLVDGKGTLVDLLNQSVRAPATATVILRADADSESYSVFNRKTRKAETTKKKDKILGLGNTVWLLVERPAGDYTIVFHGLKSIAVKPGDAVAPGQVIAEESGESGTKGGWEIWRVHGSDQHFLRPGTGERPYRVMPLVAPKKP